MKILEVCTSQSLGGLELYFVTCCQQLSNLGSQVHCVVLQDSSIWKKLQGKSLPVLSTSGSKIKLLVSILSLLKKSKPEIVHTHDKKDLLIIALCKVLSPIRFQHVHTRQMNMPRAKKGLYHRFIYSKIDLFITITERLKQQVLEKVGLPSHKVKCLYYGVPAPNPAKENPFKNLGNSSIKIGVVARIDRKKQQHLAIEAVSLLKQKKIFIDLFIVGSVSHPDYEASLKEQIASLGLSDQVFMTGFMDQPQTIMSYFDVIILTTGEETFGLVLAEAMRMGVAVIGANGGGVPEIIDHEKTGLLFEPGDSQGLAIAIEKLINDERLLEELASQGKQKADKFFNIAHHFKALEATFQELNVD